MKTRISVRTTKSIRRALGRLRNTRALVLFCPLNGYFYYGTPVPDRRYNSVFFGARVARDPSRQKDGPNWCHWIVADTEQAVLMLVDGDDLLQAGCTLCAICPFVYVEEFDPPHHPRDFFEMFSANVDSSAPGLIYRALGLPEGGDTSAITKNKSDLFPPEPAHRHVMTRAIRRILIQPDDMDRLTAARDLVAAIERSPFGPWLDHPAVDAFVSAHSLLAGDVLDFADCDGNMVFRIRSAEPVLEAGCC